MTRSKLLGRLSAVAVAVACATTIACSKTDPGITTAIKTKMASDDTVKAYKINVDTKDGIVTLNGDVDSQAAKARAIEIAKATDGVRDVVDHLTLAVDTSPTTGRVSEASRDAQDKATDTGDVLGDAGITTAVKTKMLADTTVSGLKIDVDTTNGVVSLTGNVSSAAEKRRALEIARETKGVKSVKDHLKIAAKK
jgi:hyperosmotically inducible periplasmic protein